MADAAEAPEAAAPASSDELAAAPPESLQARNASQRVLSLVNPTV